MKNSLVIGFFCVAIVSILIATSYYALTTDLNRETPQENDAIVQESEESKEPNEMRDYGEAATPRENSIEDVEPLDVSVAGDEAKDLVLDAVEGNSLIRTEFGSAREQVPRYTYAWASYQNPDVNDEYLPSMNIEIYEDQQGIEYRLNSMRTEWSEEGVTDNTLYGQRVMRVPNFVMWTHGTTFFITYVEEELTQDIPEKRLVSIKAYLEQYPSDYG